MPRRKGRDLNPQERDLWKRVARTAKPLERSTLPPAPPDPVVPPAPARAKNLRSGVRIPEGFAIGAHSRPDDTPPSQSSEAVRMDRKKFNRMSRGKLEPESRIDLHGLTLAAAQPALAAFILSAQAAGKRLVLVITGKGRGAETGGPIPNRPGALKRQVPMWLTSPPLSRSVLQVAEAHRRHGGSGAYYVYLRRG